ncbi:RagB/SusD family nutrient uptake outer membrane protein [Rhodothermus marinus]|uniref:RagB/SusD family nutrient uptake outer membrane protein n=1 Tax=Rhodothermus marinus (strain ATCC 43812 / DSM 4252 / R-10) TaxID=518766 RepID=D0MH25_RHOM4|nr:RagB/SusD family nutrient uptake outer membrane protein [Rhodothermus marinus]ACY47810.1 hypothetical protein Rmar_0916 [Rhodothermus marinus DSM 4252]
MRYDKSLWIGLLVFSLGLSIAGCNLLDVNNPNNLVEEDLGNPAAAEPMVNGVEAAVTRAVQAILTPYSTATDELVWVGSRDAWQQLDFGNVDDPFNEFTDAAFPYVAEARWWADAVIARLEAFRNEGALSDPTVLARAYLYGAIIYVTIADMFDDFAFSDRMESAPPIGRDGLPQVYDTAINYLDRALAIAEARNNTALQGQILMFRARAKYSKALRAMLRPGQVQVNGLVNDAGAVADAQAALAVVDPEARVILDMDPNAPDLVIGDLSLGDQVNSRLEMRIGDTYIQPTPNNKQTQAVIFKDIIDTEVVHPFVEQEITAFHAAGLYPDMTVASEREMHLILAEAMLASGDVNGFATHINHLRTRDGLTPYDPNSSGIEPIEMLRFSRQAYLFLQGRRLADHYRFNDPSPEWRPDGTAMRQPGTFFPITIIERRANPYID